ncbi:uncharacterized protein LOC126576711, partial [Anopheles aquasalis]|uniref:uncharacterized protein LOC126576711 n=1 Tax=Anopheles aquasalis TaxID=42839 RepID=UPI00215B1E9A
RDLVFEPAHLRVWWSSGVNGSVRSVSRSQPCRSPGTCTKSSADIRPSSQIFKRKMNRFVVAIVLSTLVIGALGEAAGRDASVRDRAGNSYESEILVESSLNVRKANPAVRRQVRSVLDLLVPPPAGVLLVREKRQWGGFDASSAQANANAFNQFQGPNGFGASAANAGAQSFYNQGPGGGFGASAANSASQGFAAGPGGFSGSAGQSGSQSYKLPGNKDVNLSYSGGFSVANGQPSVSQGSSISFSYSFAFRLRSRMYHSTIAFVVLCGVALSVAYPYPYPQSAFMYYRNAYPMMIPQLQQSAMYQQATRMYQNQRLRSQRRSASSGGVSAFAAGNTIATGTLLNAANCQPADQVPVEAPAIQSFAEAYPAEASPENDIPFGDESDLLGDVEASALDTPTSNDDALFDLPVVPAAVAPVPDKRKKKVTTTVQLDSASGEEEQDDDEADEGQTAVSFGTRRGSSSSSNSRPASGPMFPVTFGSTNGGAIAIANSYSTGKGGSATSHATAYGSPAAIPEERRRSVSAQQQQLRSNRPAKLRTRY